MTSIEKINESIGDLYRLWGELRERVTALEVDNLSVTLEDLKKLCDKYDGENGSFPESEYEGATVYKFVSNHVKSRTNKSRG